MASNRQNFLSSQIAPGNANEPCRYNYIFPARIALSSQTITPFMKAGKLAIEDLPVESVEPYRYTLRVPREGELYLTHKASQKLTVFSMDKQGKINHLPWIAIEKSITEFYIAFSEWIWDEEFQKKVSEYPGKYMQKVTLAPGSPSVGTAAQIGTLVEEYREAPGKVVSLRGFSKAKAEDICDSESVYADEETYAPQGEHGMRYLTRRWRDSGFDFFWKPLKEGAIPEVPCPEAQRKNRVFLLALHDSVGIAREFASLHATSVATLSSRNDWYAYPHTIAMYAKTLLAANPGYGEHLQQDYHVIESYWLGPWARSHGFSEPPEEMKRSVRPAGPDEKLRYERGERPSDTPPYARIITWAVIREARRFPGAVKGKATLVVHDGIDLAPRGAHEFAWGYDRSYISKLPAGTQGHPLPGTINGQPRWVLQPYEYLPARWDERGINGFLEERKQKAKIIASQLKSLTDARTAWLRAGGTHSFVATMSRGNDTSLAFLQRREEAYAACHAAFTVDDEGKSMAETLYLKGKGEPAKLFKDVMAGKVAGQNAFVQSDDSLTALIETFGFYLSHLPEAEAKELHDAWDARLYPDADPKSIVLSLWELTKIVMQEGLAALEATKQENKEAEAAFNAAKKAAKPAAPLSQHAVQPHNARKAAGKPLEFYIREVILKESVKWAPRGIETIVTSRWFASIIKDPSDIRSATKAAKAFGRHMKYWALCQAMVKFGEDPSLASFLKLGKAVSTVLAVRRSRAVLMAISKQWGSTGKWANGVIVLLGKKSAATGLGLFADLAESYSLYENNDYDAAAATAGTAVVTVVLVSLGGTFAVVSVPVAILGAILAGYWKNSLDEDWLTHCFWGRYYDKAYKTQYPSFSYRQFFAKLEADKTPEDKNRNPEPQPEAVQEHGEQQRQWVSMMSEPTLTCALFADFTPDAKFESFIYVKGTVRLFDPLQSSIVISASVSTVFKKQDIAVSSAQNECMPVPFRMILETPHGNENSGTGKTEPDSSGVSKQIQTVSLEGVFSVAALQKIAKSGHTSSGDFTFEPQLGLDMSFKYLPEMEINKHKDCSINTYFNFDEGDMGDAAARTRYKTLLKEMAHDAQGAD